MSRLVLPFEKTDAELSNDSAYEPREFMSPIHCAPQDSVRLFQDVRAKRAIGMHWGCVDASRTVSLSTD